MLRCCGAAEAFSEEKIEKDEILNKDKNIISLYMMIQFIRTDRAETATLRCCGGFSEREKEKNE